MIGGGSHHGEHTVFEASKVDPRRRLHSEAPVA
jgi:hypothetical protein